jgi:hypothetical protein
MEQHIDLNYLYHSHQVRSSWPTTPIAGSWLIGWARISSISVQSQTAFL